MRSRDIARKLTLNGAIECERVGERKMLALPSSAMLRAQRFGRGPSILTQCFTSWRHEATPMQSGRGWLFQA